MSVFKAGLFAGKVAIVTGGGSGIGKAIATELATLGCGVAIASRNLERLEEAASGISSRWGADAVRPFRCNIRSEQEVQATVGSVLREFGRVDFLVNNGGGQFLSSAEDIRLKGWNAVVETNLTGTFLMSKEVYAQHMRDSGGGSIVNITCDMLRGFPLMMHTGAARAAVENMTKTLAVEWAHSGVRVNNVAPGVIYSASAEANYQVGIFEAAKPRLPAKRLGTPEEVSSAVCFLLSPGASFINGATLKVDSGSCLYSPPLHEIPDHEKMPPYKWQS